MSESPLVPENLDQLRQLMAETRCLLPVGNCTKSTLSRCDDATLVSLRSIRGITEYEPSEFTFTAWAGTPVAEIEQTLQAKQQYLPFDPMLVEAGATIGGTIAAGLSGPGRFRYGGVRDFLIGVKLLGVDGQMVQGGGKVVKNAAGFDLPKFLVGSLGRYALMVEVTFKVFPRPVDELTWSVPCGSHQEAVQRISSVACSRWEADAVDYRPGDGMLRVRLAAPRDAIDQIAGEMQSKWPEGQVLDASQSDPFWQGIRELRWADFEPSVIVKVPTTLASFLSLQQSLEAKAGVSMHLSVAGGVAWIALDGDANVSWLDDQLKALQLAGLVVRGTRASPKIGAWRTSEMQQAVKQAMDPQAKFPGV